MTFVHLTNHSEYSLLNGAIKIESLVDQAKAFDMPAVALTDYANIFGAVDFYSACKSQGIQPILGATVFYPSYDDHTKKQFLRGTDQLYQLVLLVKDQTGYQNLCRLLTKSYMDGFYYKARVDTALLKEFSEGLICLSGGWDGAIHRFLFEGKNTEATQHLQKLATIYKNNFYLELNENGLEGQTDINHQAIELAQKEGIPFLASNKCHYLKQIDAEAFEALQNIQLGGSPAGIHGQMKFSKDGYFLKTIEQMQTDFDYAPAALKSTVDILPHFKFEFDFKSYHFPRFEPENNLSLDESLIEEAKKGLEKRWPQIIEFHQHQNNSAIDENELQKQYQERLKIELDVILNMGFAGYFLIVADFIGFAKNNDIPVGPGRGSAAGSLVAFCLEITDLDPIPYNLLFERFLNPERISMPDVDIDFCVHGRDKVIDYVGQKYGNVSQIITFGKMKAKAVVRDVGRVMEMPYEEVDKIAKLIPNTLNITLDDAFKEEPRLKELMQQNGHVNQLMNIALKLEGLSRHASTHAAGVVISDKPLTDYLPLYKGSNGDVVTQYDMKAVEKIGLIKFDFLGLKTLTLIDATLKIAEQVFNEKIDIQTIALDDEKVFELLKKGDTSGVFQLESGGMKDLMVRLKPNTFEDIIALVALYRPGPLGSGMVDDFIERKHGLKPIVNLHANLKDVLKDTYGVIVYQEQVMQIASILGGFSLGEADILRRAMGKKKASEMAAQKVRFLKGAADKKIEAKKAEEIFDLMAKFAEYGFNKSHSAAYAFISYQTAYLKAHFTIAFFCATLNGEIQNTDKINYYLQDIKAHGIELLPPDVNQSDYAFVVEGKNQIRYGLGALKNTGKAAIESIIESRKKVGEFKSFFQFIEKLDLSKMNKRVLESMIKAGAFDQLDTDRANLFSQLEPALNWAQQKQKEAASGQTSLFSQIETTEKPVEMTQAKKLFWSNRERLDFEKECFGFYFSNHPIQTYRNILKQVVTTSIRQCQNKPNETSVTVAGTINDLKIITTKKGKRMAFMELEDLSGKCEVILFSDSFKKFSELLEKDELVIVKGKLERKDEGIKVFAEGVELLENYLGRRAQKLVLEFDVKDLKLSDLEKLKQKFTDCEKGKNPVFVRIKKQSHWQADFQTNLNVDLTKQEQLVAGINQLFQKTICRLEFWNF